MNRLTNVRPMLFFVLILQIFTACTAEDFTVEQEIVEDEINENYTEATIYYETSGDKTAIVYARNGDKKTFTNGKKVGHTQEAAPDPIALPEDVTDPEVVEIIEDTAWPDNVAIEETTPEEEVETGTQNDVSGLKDANYWKNKFDANWAKEYSFFWPMAKSADTWGIYQMAYAIDANTTMFRTSGDMKYLDRALEYVEAKIAAAKLSKNLTNSTYKDNYYGWAQNNDRSELKQDEIPLYESFGFRMATTLLRVLHENPSILAQGNYEARYNAILEFVEKNIWEKWSSRSMGHLYRSNVHMASHWARMGLNLYKITGNDKYLQVYNDWVYANPRSKLAMKSLIAESSTDEFLLWKAKPGSNFNDISHANAEVALMLETVETNMNDFTMEEMTKLCNTLERKLMTKTSPYAFYINGSGSSNLSNYNEGWFRLGRFNTKVQEKLENEYASGSNPTAKNTLRLAILAENFEILKSGKTTY